MQSENPNLCGHAIFLFWQVENVRCICIWTMQMEFGPFDGIKWFGFEMTPCQFVLPEKFMKSLWNCNRWMLALCSLRCKPHVTWMGSLKNAFHWLGKPFDFNQGVKHIGTFSAPSSNFRMNCYKIWSIWWTGDRWICWSPPVYEGKSDSA